jgi:hypothetical protein
MSYSQIAVPAFSKKIPYGLNAISSYGESPLGYLVSNIYEHISKENHGESVSEYFNSISFEKSTHNLNVLVNYLGIGVRIDGEYISLNKEMGVAMRKLEELRKLEENWNENGANPFDVDLIRICKKIVAELPVVPEIYPTACSSVQFEYETEDKYLEFEIYLNHTEVYMCVGDEEAEYDIEHVNNYIQEIRQVVVDFYE